MHGVPKNCPILTLKLGVAVTVIMLALSFVSNCSDNLILVSLSNQNGADVLKHLSISILNI